jgi:hypothetical protein
MAVHDPPSPVVTGFDPVYPGGTHRVERELVAAVDEVGRPAPLGRVRCAACRRSRAVSLAGTAGLAGVEWLLFEAALALHGGG